MANAEKIKIEPSIGWVLIAPDDDGRKFIPGQWYVCWHDVFCTKKDALEHASKHAWPKPYRAVRGQLAAIETRR